MARQGGLGADPVLQKAPDTPNTPYTQYVKIMNPRYREARAATTSA